MPNFQTFIGIVTALLVFVTSVFLAYDKLQFRNYTFIPPQWSGLLLAAITFSFVAVDQILRGFVRLEELQQRAEELQQRAEEAQRRIEEEQRRTEERDRRAEAAERETRRTRIEARYRAVLIRFLLVDTPIHRRQLENVLALLEEYRDTL